ncbi:MAG: phosphatidylserine decarboxylase [Planctomycetota bacterium]
MNQPNDPHAVRCFHRERGVMQDETTCCGAGLRFLYGSFLGGVARLVLRSRLVNKIGGLYFSSPLSLDHVKTFVQAGSIAMEEFEATDYNSFNEFFTRRFRAGARSFANAQWEFPAFAEGRYLAFSRVTHDITFPVKGYQLTPKAILGDEEQAEPFLGGPALIARLNPYDYHRFHYPDSGRHIGSADLKGGLDSVNPFALRARGSVFARNHRRVSYLTTQNFGRLAYVEIGAMGVGKIVQTKSTDDNFERGEEKGYFKYGGSTVIVFGEPGFWQPTDDLLARTAEQCETIVRLGTCVAHSLRRRAEIGKLVGQGDHAYRVTRG